MKTTKVAKVMAGVMVAGFAWCATADGPAISDVVVRQRWPWSRLVDIDYVLTCDPSVSVDIQVTAQDGTVPLDLPFASLSGHIYNVTPGPRRIIFDPTKTAYTNNQMLTQFSVTLTPTLVPLYMIVDLTKSAGADGQIEYVYEEDLTNGLWGAWVRNPVTNRGTAVESVVWTGVTTNDIYKTDKLVLRRVPAGNFTMGGAGHSPHAVTLTKGYYAGVFETTQMQWYRVAGGSVPGDADKMKPRVAPYYALRENATNNNSDNPDIDWPATGHTVAPDSFIGRLREKTGIGGFDLPTDAQWEYLCRAGTTTDFNSGEMWSADFTNTINRLAWWRANGSNTTHTVGEKRPNAWGLYDVHGNAWEWCLDWYTNVLVAATDPTGPVTGMPNPSPTITTPTRVRRGGGTEDDWHWQRSFARTADGKPEIPRGFRLVRTLP